MAAEPMPRVFASGVYGSDYDLWGAWSFTDKRTRDKLAAEIGDDDWCLAIGMTSGYTPPAERGRLLALLQIGHEAIDTRELVDPEHWRRTVEEHGEGKWLHAFPIRRVERFVPGPTGLPLRSATLPRIDAENRYMQVGRYFLELDSDEVARVMALPREPDGAIYRTPASDFAANLRKARNGPPPTAGTRTLTAASGPAATYLAELRGDALDGVVAPVVGATGHRVWKIGFSNDPDRRLAELNAHLPHAASLAWRMDRAQWHSDEINAFAMEQRFLELVAARGVNRFKGEMLAAAAEDVGALWAESRASARRPSPPVAVRASPPA